MWKSPIYLDTGEKLINEGFGPDNTERRRTGTLDPRLMKIEDGRLRARTFFLDENGFMLIEHGTAVENFFDRQEVESVYRSAKDGRARFTAHTSFDDSG